MAMPAQNKPIKNANKKKWQNITQLGKKAKMEAHLQPQELGHPNKAKSNLKVCKKDRNPNAD